MLYRVAVLMLMSMTCIACALQTEGDAATPEDVGDEPFVAAGLLLEHSFSPTHKLEIREDQPGIVALAEAGVIGKDEPASYDFATTAKLYLHLVDPIDANVLAKLEAADRRVARRNASVQSIPTPPAPELVEKHNWPTFNGQSICSTRSFGESYDSLWYVNQVSSSWSPWYQDTLKSRSTVLNHAGAASSYCSAEMRRYFWDGFTWAFANAYDVQNGQWRSVQTTFKWTRWNTRRLTGQCLSGGVHDHCVVEDNL